MTRLKYALSALLLVAFSATAFADEGYDEWNCRETDYLKHTYLQCVSCGMQRYFAAKAPGREVVPSERWLLLLGITAKQTSVINPNGKYKSDSDIVKNETALEFYRKRVIAQIKNYGFCTNYGKTTKGVAAKGKWQDYVYPGTTRNIDFKNSQLVEVAESFGFSDKGYGNHADENLRYLLNNQEKNLSDYKEGETPPLDFGQQSDAERKKSFVDRLKVTLRSGYDISGERNNEKLKISTSPEGDDLRVCLGQIDQMQSGQGDPLLNSFLQNSTEGTKFCQEMASACEIDGASFCGQQSSISKSSAPVQKSSQGLKPLSAPPIKKNGGTN